MSKHHHSPGVFDVSKPGKSAPTPASKPIITGHRPMAADPTLRRDPMTRPTSVPIKFAGESSKPEESNVEVKHTSEAIINPPNNSFQLSEIEETPVGSTVASSVDTGSQEEENAGFSAVLATHKADDPVGLANTAPEKDKKLAGIDATTPSYSAVDSLMDEAKNHEDNKPDEEKIPLPAEREVTHIPQVSSAIKKPKKTGGKLKIILPVILILLIAGYLAADAGAFGSGINLPFHVFKKAAPATPAATPKPASAASVKSTPAIPAGMSAFSDPAAPLVFYYPSAWGKPSVTTEDGTTKRSTDPKTESKSDGIHTYIINFGTNKDVELSATSNKYLPKRTTTAYSDYLQWCIGTSDSKFYQQTLRYTTANGIDTPTTVTCDQGPLDGAVKIDDATIMQPNVKDAAGKSMGDIYIKNLTDPELSVAHVKDATMKNGDDIKKALSSLKVVIKS